MFAGGAPADFDKRYADLERYRGRYSPEIFDYCEDTYLYDPDFRLCLRRQEKIKNRLLDYATRRLGSYPHAVALYEECTAYFPLDSAEIIGECLETRLVLHSKLGDAAAERVIYQTCDEKWRKHSILAIRNCAANSANYYRETGEFRDW